MSLEYAPHGLVGMLVPQANTAVEPECGVLLPDGVGLLAGRLCSPRPTIEERLVDYFETLQVSVGQFAGVPLGALGFACTGASYLAGRDREDEVFAALGARLGCLVTSSALAVVDALTVLSARRIALVSPYPDSLTQHSIGYWRSRGFDVGPVEKATGDTSSRGHPVYGLGSDAAMQALAALRGQGPFDMVVMLGTGLPTLRAILAMPVIDGAPVVSCTMALAWRCARALSGAAPDADSLLRFVRGDDWKQRYMRRTLAAHDGLLSAR